MLTLPIGALKPALRNYILSQSSAVHEKSYNPVQVRENLSRIAFGDLAGDNNDLIERYRQASFTQDPHAPLYLTIEEHASMESRKDLTLLRAAHRKARDARDKKRANQISARMLHIRNTVEALILEEKRTQYFTEVDHLRSLGQSTKHLHDRDAFNPRRTLLSKLSKLAAEIGGLMKVTGKEHDLDRLLLSYLRENEQTGITIFKSENCQEDKQADNCRLPRCLLCGKSYSTQASLNRHTWGYHNFNEPFPCPECHVTVQPGSNAWAYHVTEAHDHIDMPQPSAARSLCCLLCGKRFTQKGLQEHFKRQYITQGSFESKFDCPRCLRLGKSAVIDGLACWIDHAETVHGGDADLFGAVHDTAALYGNRGAPSLKRKAEEDTVDDYLESRWKRLAPS